MFLLIQGIFRAKHRLYWLQKMGTCEVVKLLLGRGDVDAVSEGADGRNALSWAAENRHEKVVEHLLNHRDASERSNKIRMFLALVEQNAHRIEGVAQVVEKLRFELFRAETSRDPFGRTPLLWAAERGR